VVGRDAEGSQADERVIDLERAAKPGPPPVAGAQWDELHRRWEVWDDAAQAWLAVREGSGERYLPLDEAPLPPPRLASELVHADDIDPLERHVIDIDRLAAPPQPVPGAQWNEVVGRWERWDDASGDWVEARPGDVIQAWTPEPVRGRGPRGGGGRRGR
jgi:hypothetical protein